MNATQRYTLGLGLTVLAAAASVFLLQRNIHGQSGPADQVFQLLAQKDSSIPDVVATVNGQALPSTAYQGELDMVKVCVENSQCSASQTDQKLGTANVALTLAVDKLLLLEYGQSKGISVSDADVQAALNDEVKGMQQQLSQGGSDAQIVRENLAVGHLTDPSQILSNTAWHKAIHDALLRGKTIQSYAPQSSGQNQFQAEDDLLLQLQQQGSISVKISAHLLDPHELRVEPASPANPPAPPSGPLPAGTPGAFPGTSAPPLNGPLQIGSSGITVP